MGDPLSVAASVLTLAQAVEYTWKSIKDVRGAEQAVEDVKGKVDTVRSVLEHSKRAIGNTGYVANTSPGLDTDMVISRIENKLAKLDKTLMRFNGLNSKAKIKLVKLQWPRQKTKIEALLRSVREDALLLEHYMTVMTFSSTIQIRSQIDGLMERAESRVCKTRANPNNTPRLKKYLQTDMGVLVSAHEFCLDRSSPSDDRVAAPTDSILYFLGVLLISISGTHPRCDCSITRCRQCQQSNVSYTFHISLPMWLFTRLIVGSLLFNRTTGLSLRYLRFPNTRCSTDSIFRLVQLGRLDDIHAAFDSGDASPWDVDEDGNTLLWVHLPHTLNPQTS
ncbi:hypothetical protein EJ04DRAFT_197066 [Polyplosphaeria fusca]|uniref:Fungal N-terminal domain-containing protein n=1 Tax=Polyplosphaeria fusca TaxID=682080 RepID=A0A9P4V894_9PLEO|nr:hypothetical protein EJ04DRAFT_197066 [Polyplosphaeria fusca]